MFVTGRLDDALAAHAAAQIMALDATGDEAIVSTATLNASARGSSPTM
jgi:hypothetical protein